jgi:hypothetical protein
LEVFRLKVKIQSWPDWISISFAELIIASVSIGMSDAPRCKDKDSDLSTAPLWFEMTFLGWSFDRFSSICSFGDSNKRRFPSGMTNKGI